MKPELLERIGLTKGESKVYLSLLSLGEGTSGEAAKKAGVSSSKIYEILSKLVSKGLAGRYEKGGKKYFSASDPQRLEEYLMKEEKALNEKKELLKELLPGFEKMKKEKEPETSAGIFEGIKGFQAVRERTLEYLKKGETLRVFGVSEKAAKELYPYLKNYHKRRAMRGIKFNVFLNYKASDKYLADWNKKKTLSKAKRPPFYVESTSWFQVYSDRLDIGDLSEKMVVISIKNREIANSFSSFFDNLWKNTK